MTNRLKNESLDISRDQFTKLVKSKVYSPTPEQDGDSENVSLTHEQIAMFENGVAFGKYLIVLKNVLVWIRKCISDFRGETTRI